MKVTIHSNIGKRRTTNQDYADYFVNETGQHLFVLCDGVGGHQAGDVASKETSQFVGKQFKTLQHPLTQDNIENWIYTTIQAVNHHIYELSTQRDELAGMGTTMVLAIVLDDQIVIAHVGDSRAYKYYKGNLTQLTQDHSLINELIRSGKITEEEGLLHPHRHAVTRSIGNDLEVMAEITRISIDAIEILMICSDGLTNMVQNEAIREYIDKQQHNEQLGELLVAAANEAGGADNISIILVSEFTSHESEVNN